MSRRCLHPTPAPRQHGQHDRRRGTRGAVGAALRPKDAPAVAHQRGRHPPQGRHGHGLAAQEAQGDSMRASCHVYSGCN